MEEKIEKSYEEIQLDFAFVTESLNAPVMISEESRAGRASRTARPRGLEKALIAAQSALLEASLDEIDAHLLPLFEFCEAALTRTLDLTPLRKGELFSPEEHRSLRGIGQAQWLLTEASMKHAQRVTVGKEKKSKRAPSTEKKESPD